QRFRLAAKRGMQAPNPPAARDWHSDVLLDACVRPAPLDAICKTMFPKPAGHSECFHHSEGYSPVRRIRFAYLRIVVWNFWPKVRLSIVEINDAGKKGKPMYAVQG